MPPPSPYFSNLTNTFCTLATSLRFVAALTLAILVWASDTFNHLSTFNHVKYFLLSSTTKLISTWCAFISHSVRQPSLAQADSLLAHPPASAMVDSTLPSSAAGLNPFAAKQNLTFSVLSLSDESGWKEKTLVCRILLSNGSQTELHLVKDAKAQWEAMGFKTCPLPTPSYSMEIPRQTLRPYKNTTRTGIHAAHFIRLQFRTAVQRATQAMLPSLVTDHAHCPPGDLDTLTYDTVVNIAGHVLSLSSLQQADILPKRTVELQHNDYCVPVTLLGPMAKLQWDIGQLVVRVKRHYQGLTNLETTRLAWRCVNPPWLNLTPPTKDNAAASPARKALRRENLAPVTVAALLATDPSDASVKAVAAQPAAVTEKLFEETLWVAADRMRLPLTLHDSSGEVRCTWWSADWGRTFDLEQVSTMFTQCNTEDGQATFLAAINTAIAGEARWVLRPKIWHRDNGSQEMQWHVVSTEPLNHAFAAPPSDPLAPTAPATIPAKAAQHDNEALTED